MENLYLYLSANDLTGFPAEFQTVDLSGTRILSDNPGLSCANVGAGTAKI